jgi:hypothetical protein
LAEATAVILPVITGLMTRVAVAVPLAGIPKMVQENIVGEESTVPVGSEQTKAPSALGQVMEVTLTPVGKVTDILTPVAAVTGSLLVTLKL